MANKSKLNKAMQLARGGQLAILNIGTNLSVNKTLLQYVLLVFIGFLLLLTWWFVPVDEWHATMTYARSLLAYHLGRAHNETEVIVHGVHYQMAMWQIIDSPYFIHAAANFWWYTKMSLAVSAILSGVTYFFASAYFIKRGQEITEDKVIRGATLASNKEVIKLLRLRKQASDRFTLGGVPIVQDSEIRHFGMHGTTGAGKSTEIREVMDQIRNPLKADPDGQGVICFDDNGAFVVNYYCPDRGDVILNPFDSRCPYWDLWEECITPADFDNFARCLIPEGAEKDPFWLSSARRLVSDAAYRLGQMNQKRLEVLIRSLLNIKLEDLQIDFLSDLLFALQVQP
jgi:hypothetical protein